MQEAPQLIKAEVPTSLEMARAQTEAYAMNPAITTSLELANNGDHERAKSHQQRAHELGERAVKQFDELYGNDTSKSYSETVDAKLSDSGTPYGDRAQIREDAAFSAARNGEVERMEGLMYPRGRLGFKKSEGVSAPGIKAQILAEAVSAGHPEYTEEMIKNAKRAVGTREDQIDVHLAAAEAGWQGGVPKAREVMNGLEPYAFMARGRAYINPAKLEEAEVRIKKLG